MRWIKKTARHSKQVFVLGKWAPAGTGKAAGLVVKDPGGTEEFLEDPAGDVLQLSPSLLAGDAVLIETACWGPGAHIVGMTMRKPLELLGRSEAQRGPGLPRSGSWEVAAGFSDSAPPWL